MSLDGWDERAFQREFERDLRNAQKIAGRKIGPKVVREAQARLGNSASSKLKKKIHYRVRKNGTFVAIDATSNARIRNFGGQISAPGGKGLRIPLHPGYRGKAIKFLVKTKSGQMLGFGQTSTGVAPIAIIRRRVTVHAAPRSQQLRPIVAKYFDTFIAEMRRALYGG